MKTCRKCGETKPLGQFHRATATRDRRQHTCAECARVIAKANYYANREARLAQKSESYRKNPEKFAARNRRWNEANPEKVRDISYRNRYGISFSQYETYLDAQSGVCAICGDSPEGDRRKNLDVDHDHESGEVRGLLCNRCNLVLGMVQDRIDLLGLMTQYIRKCNDKKVMKVS